MHWKVKSDLKRFDVGSYGDDADGRIIVLLLPLNWGAGDICTSIFHLEFSIKSEWTRRKNKIIRLRKRMELNHYWLAWNINQMKIKNKTLFCVLNKSNIQIKNI